MDVVPTIPIQNDIANGSQITTTPNSLPDKTHFGFNLKYVFLVLTAILICLLFLFLGIKLEQTKSLNIPLLGLRQTRPTQTLWTNQSAAVRGKILKVDGNILPVRLDHPAVKQAYIDYDFRVEVKDVKEEAGKKRIITNINGKNIPEFIVDNKTLVVFNAVGKEQSVPFPESSNLKDEKISIIARYYLNSKSWRVAKITLYSPEGVTTIPSSRSNKK